MFVGTNAGVDDFKERVDFFSGMGAGIY